MPSTPAADDDAYFERLGGLEPESSTLRLARTADAAPASVGPMLLHWVFCNARGCISTAVATRGVPGNALMGSELASDARGSAN